MFNTGCQEQTAYLVQSSVFYWLGIRNLGVFHKMSQPYSGLLQQWKGPQLHWSTLSDTRCKPALRAVGGNVWALHCVPTAGGSDAQAAFFSPPYSGSYLYLEDATRGTGTNTLNIRKVLSFTKLAETMAKHRDRAPCVRVPQPFRQPWAFWGHGQEPSCTGAAARTVWAFGLFC